MNNVPAVEPLLRQPEKKELIEAVRAVNKAELFGQDNELTFVLDRRSHKMLVRIVNKETRELVRQIPTEYLQYLASDLAVK
ncbi:MAG: flagellar protein FlaG [Bryobacteraceae bacterium]